jgi:hypothetical protein
MPSPPTSHTVTGLTNGTEYEFRTAGVDACGVGTYSAAARATPSVPGDPLWSSVGLLVPFDTNTTDVKSGIVPTVSGSSPTITAEGKFGSYASWSTSSSGLAYSVTAPGTGDFTIECWFRRDASSWGFSGARVIALGSNSVYVRIRAGDLNRIGASWANDPLEEGASFHGEDFVPTQSQWHHVAIVRQSSRFRFYWNGVQTGNSLPPVAMNLTGNLEVGHSSIAAEGMRLDDFRYTLACRYPDGTTFTPPTAAFLTN